DNGGAAAAVPDHRRYRGRDLRARRPRLRHHLQRLAGRELRPGRVRDDRGDDRCLVPRARAAVSGGARARRGRDRGGRVAAREARDRARAPRLGGRDHHHHHRRLDLPARRGHAPLGQEHPRAAALLLGHADPPRQRDAHAAERLGDGRNRRRGLAGVAVLPPHPDGQGAARVRRQPHGRAPRRHQRVADAPGRLRPGGAARGHRRHPDRADCLHVLRRRHHARPQGLRRRDPRRHRQPARGGGGRRAPRGARVARRRVHLLRLQGRGRVPGHAARAVPAPGRPVWARRGGAGLNQAPAGDATAGAPMGAPEAAAPARAGWRRLRESHLGGLALFAALLAALPLAAPDNYFVTVVGVTAGINAILAVSLNLFMGYAGQISLGHAAFAGMGAYASAILTTRYGVDPWVAMAAALALVGVFAHLIARPVLRLKGHYLAMATLGFGIIINIVMVQEEAYTGGPDGMSGIPGLSLFGWRIESDLEWYAVVAAVLVAVMAASLNVGASRAGRALKAVHGSEIAAQTMGIDTARAKTQVFVFSALIACFAGSLFAHQQA